MPNLGEPRLEGCAPRAGGSQAGKQLLGSFPASVLALQKGHRFDLDSRVQLRSDTEAIKSQLFNPRVGLGGENSKKGPPGQAPAYQIAAHFRVLASVKRTRCRTGPLLSSRLPAGCPGHLWARWCPDKACGILSSWAFPFPSAEPCKRKRLAPGRASWGPLS